MHRLLFGMVAGAALYAQPASLEFLNHGHPVLDAHNCYPYEGRWADRIDRALSSGSPVSIEQDLAWWKGEAVLSHTAKTTGSEPTLRHYFFERVRPLVEQALARSDRASWPVIILHFDFKSNEKPLLRAVWKLLGEYEAWLTTAPKTADPHQLAPLDAKPILVVTEDSDAQEEVFFGSLPVGAKLRLFGSAHTAALDKGSRQERAHLAATLPPDKLLIDRPTNYRRWWNNSWYEVEEGGQARAGEWTKEDAGRLKALVEYAHQRGYWIRFYTLDGFTPSEDRGWGDNYNFGSSAAVQLRWRAALEAGVDFIATDQYEDLAAVMRASPPRTTALADPSQ